MVDRETDRHARGDIPRVTDFLEIGTDGHGKIKEDVVKDVHERDHQLGLGEPVSQEDQDQTGVFQAEDAPLPEAGDGFAQQRVEKEVDEVVGDEEQGDLADAEGKDLDQ